MLHICPAVVSMNCGRVLVSYTHASVHSGVLLASYEEHSAGADNMDITQSTQHFFFGNVHGCKLSSESSEQVWVQEPFQAF